MVHLLALNLDVDASPGVEIHGRDGAVPIGWGLAWYPGSGSGAATFRGPTAPGDHEGDGPGDWRRMAEALRSVRRQRSTMFMGAFGAPEGRARRDIDPFVRSYAGRDWALAYDGDPGAGLTRALPLDGMPLLEPVGASREHVLAWLLSRLLAEGARTLAAFGAAPLRRLLERLDGEGVGNVLVTDGDTLAVYAGREAGQRMGWARHVPPMPPAAVRTPDVTLLFDSPRDGRHTLLAAGTDPATDGWVQLAPGELVLVRRAAVMDASAPPSVGAAARRRRLPSPPSGERAMTVLHETRYRYASPVQSSSHRMRLEPVHDLHQELHFHELAVSVQAARTRFEDVFGNMAVSAEIEHPYTELAVCATSRVTVRAPADPRAHGQGDAVRLPLVWMPWQRQMLLPYLLPPELPETQLRELIDYAESFVRRNDASVIRTLWDINETINDEYGYVSGSTGLETTPFEVYVHRRGVCQDFANLLICLARLLGVPARYRVGYIHTGADYENQVQSDASHAWVEIYLPWLGWVGLDPTNGCLAGLDHVRVACGRNYRDATPTAGTIWQGGGGEELTVRVEVTPD